MVDWGRIINNEVDVTRFQPITRESSSSSNKKQETSLVNDHLPTNSYSFCSTGLLFPMLLQVRMGFLRHISQILEPYGTANVRVFRLDALHLLSSHQQHPIHWVGIKWSLASLCLSLSVLTAIFPGETGLAGFIGAEDEGSK